ncbi:MAG: 2-C-methyl-D-erythritol 4-phosphate cytidylyltransferase [Gammaproteobacteria bacterium]
MATSLRYWAIIPAAGTSQRMGAETPKQYLPLADTTVIEASLSNFLCHPKVAGIVVALHADDQYWNTLALKHNEKIHTVMGGESRAESVYNAIRYLENTPAANDDFLLVHDAARPCLRKTDLDLLIQQLEQDDVGGILASPVCDTLKIIEQQAETNNIVCKTPDRKKIWRAFTPQMFRLSTLKNALTHCKKNNIIVTDEASAVEALGLPVKLITGQSDNIKITNPEDLVLASAIYQKINN